MTDAKLAELRDAAPERIWATVNGVRSELLGGSRYVIGGWAAKHSSPREVEYVRADTLASQSERIKSLEGALAPFAAEASNWSDSVPDEHRSLCTEPGSKTAHPGSETAFSVGDLRRARATLDGGSHGG